MAKSKPNPKNPRRDHQHPRKDRLSALVKALTKKHGGFRAVSASCRLSHSTLNEWASKAKYPTFSSLQSLANGVHISVDAIEGYLEGSIYLSELIAGSTLTPVEPLPEEQRLNRHQILQWIDTRSSFEAEDILKILKVAAEWLERNFEPKAITATQTFSPHTIQELISKELEQLEGDSLRRKIELFAESSLLIEPERVEAIIVNGERPSAEDLVGLARVLKKDDGTTWTPAELEKITNTQYGRINGNAPQVTC